MEKISRKRLFLGVLLSAFLLACTANNDERQAPARQQKWLTAEVRHAIRNVQIITSGIPEAWEKAELSVPDSAVLIALLVEENTSVKKGDLLAGLITFTGREEYVPVNLTSPIDGVVTKVDYGLQAHIPGGMRIIEIKNFNHYILRIHVYPFQMDYIKKGAKAELLLNKARLKARVYKIDRTQNEVLLLTDPVPGLTIEEEVFPVRIECPQIKGCYLPERFFLRSDSVEVLLQDNISLEVYAVGRSDSLVLIHPPLPDVRTLRVKQ